MVSAHGNATAQKFGYNGIELEESLGLNLMEMDLRLYDPAIARWNAIDPVTHHSMSTYTSFDNNPVYWADPSGADAVVSEGGNRVTFTGQDAVDAFNIIKNNAGSGNDTNSDSGDENNNCTDCKTFIDYYNYYKSLFTSKKFKKDLKDTGKGVLKGIISSLPNNPGTGEPAIKITEVSENQRFGFFAGIILFAILEPGPGGEAKAIRSLTKADSKILKFARETFESSNTLRNGANNLIEQLTKGNLNPGIGTKKVFGQVFEARSREGARVYFRQIGEAIEILGYSNKSNQQSVINRLKTLYK